MMSEIDKFIRDAKRGYAKDKRLEPAQCEYVRGNGRKCFGCAITAAYFYRHKGMTLSELAKTDENDIVTWFRNTYNLSLSSVLSGFDSGPFSSCFVFYKQAWDQTRQLAIDLGLIQPQEAC